MDRLSALDDAMKAKRYVTCFQREPGSCSVRGIYCNATFNDRRIALTEFPCFRRVYDLRLAASFDRFNDIWTCVRYGVD